MFEIVDPIMQLAPIANALADIKCRHLTSFHALPLSHGGSVQNSMFQRSYRSLFGETFLDLEQTISGEHFDSFFFPKHTIRRGEELAAELFGSEGILFVTTGTTTSNQIALDAFHLKGGHALVDRQCHQSIHFGLDSTACAMDYIQPKEVCETTGRCFWDLDAWVDQILAHEKSHGPYDLIVLNGHSYDGLVYDIPFLIGHLLEQGAASRNFFVDEAWGIGNYFLPELANGTAMRVESIQKLHPDLTVVSTQSAHKSMSCLRQASMIHFRGRHIGANLVNSRFFLHTTSPSYPILASLDLGRAQLKIEGQKLFSNAAALAARFAAEIESEPALSSYFVNLPNDQQAGAQHVRLDPTKVSLNVSRLKVAAQDVKRLLYVRYGIYVNRITENSLLFNFHIGLAGQAVDNLLSALKDIAACTKRSDEFRRGFIISYPPGVPLAVPGESLTPGIHQQIQANQNIGAMVVSV